LVKSLKGTKNGNGNPHTGYVDQAYISDKELKSQIIGEVKSLMEMGKEA
jgi:hypothetical protein